MSLYNACNQYRAACKLALKNKKNSITEDQIYWDMVEICAEDNSSPHDIQILSNYITSCREEME